MNLKEKILKEMVVSESPKEKMRREVYKELRGLFSTDEEFNKIFERAYKNNK